MHYNSLIIAIGVLCILYCFFGLSLGWGFYFGLKVILALGVILLVHGFLRKYNNLYIRSNVEKLVNIGIIIILISFIIVESMIITGAYVNDTKDVDYILILGAGIIDDRPSLELKYRLDTVIKFTKESNYNQKLILCGGKGKDEKFSEAYVMEKYLIDHGFSKDMIFKEEKSRSTYENIKYAKDIIDIVDSRDNIKVAISSNDFHLFRAKLIARRLGFEATGLPAKTPLYIIPNHHVRECFAIIKTLVVK
ncbi:YdcF family protein [Wukongibacter baidiensis]|uniref:YdcF family protein n=1 Tax=Wukongibacter baidiensis TaxID=1723361 RepID=UPI003D7F3C0F